MVESLALPAPNIRASGNQFQRQMNSLLNTRFQLQSTSSRPYDGEIMQSYVSDRLRLADIRFTPHVTRLMPGKLPPGRQNTFLVSHQVEGNTVVRQGGREAHVGANQIFLVDTSKPFWIETDDIWTRSVYLDSSFWREVFPERDFYTATALSCDVGMGRICRDLIEQIFIYARDCPPHLVNRMAGTLADLLATSMVADIAAGPEHGNATNVALDRIKTFMRENLADPELDCSAVAAHMGVSVRHVHSIFAQTGKSVMRWVWDERLRRIAREISLPAIEGKPVSAIAFEWGFREAAHFSRQFKARYGVSPTEYRRGQFPGQEPGAERLGHMD
ncbi:helix-turn-helix domain-containing protein [Mesorhizobium sp. L-8-3]|uniref:helix-turn-helix domain-containing protein n=1 Tax=Mesorhizobium sp. L-8-3 TaxID=2744522 RepID=UPI0019278EFB|nr:helix-turn-helix domain-containing protein [Mesorhizobium sp. L-8-3]BCH21495.1 hypothetical protein MesoLjLb_12800 [Mesorhizobium sp. L-8-3]